MTEIPDDVMDAAIHAYETPIFEDGSSLVSLVNRIVEDEVKLCIARAIMAERERCAKVALSVQDRSDYYNGAYDGVQDVICAINNS